MSAYAPAARTAAALSVLVPVLAISLVAYTSLFGWRMATIHVAFCGLMGAALLEGPIQNPNGPRIAFLRGPDDTRLELVERKNPAGGCC